MYRRSKRLRKDRPDCWTDCGSLLTVPCETGLLRSQQCPGHVYNLFLERLEKEVLQFWKKKEQDAATYKANRRKVFWKRHMHIGVNESSRALCQHKPLLVVLEDAGSTCLPWVHIVSSCHRKNIPLILVPDTSELAKLLDVRRISVLVLSSLDLESNEDFAAEVKLFDARIKSFVGFMAQKFPVQTILPAEEVV